MRANSIRIVVALFTLLGGALSLRADIVVGEDQGRPVTIHEPSGIGPEVPLPLILLLHGDWQNEREYRRLTGQGDDMVSVAWHPDGKKLLADMVSRAR